MAKSKVVKEVALATRGPGRPARYDTPMTQVSVGMDEARMAKARELQKMFQSMSAGEVTLADVMRQGFDMLATAMLDGGAKAKK